MNDRIKSSLSVNKGIWHVSFRLTTENGKRKQKCLSTGIKAGKDGKSNKRAAEKKAAEIVERYENLVFNDKSEMSLGDYVSDCVKRNSRIQQTTRDGYEHMISRHIHPYFDSLKLKDVKPYHLQLYISDKLNENLSPNTVNKHISLISTALKDAVNNELIKSNPADKIDKPKRTKPVNNYYTAEQLKQLFSVVKGTSMERPVFLATFFGLRRSEVAAVRWSNIDFTNHKLYICQKITRQKNEVKKLADVLGNKLKTEESGTVYDLNNAVCAYLQNKKLEQQDMPKTTNKYADFVCVNEVGERLKLDYISHKFNEILQKNKLPHIRFHDLRHSCLTLLANNKEFTMKQVQEYARHANFTLTADTYSHVLEGTKLIELNAICKSLNLTENE